MDLDKILDDAKDLLKKHKLDKWTIKWADRESMESKKEGADTFGKTDYKTMTISLSKDLTKHEKDKNRINNTILHEIAHAIDYEKNGSSEHNDRWRQIATSIGCNADMKTSSKTLDQKEVYKYQAKCDKCGQEFFSRNKVTKKRSCNKCSGGGYNKEFKLNYKEDKSIKTYEQFTESLGFDLAEMNHTKEIVKFIEKYGEVYNKSSPSSHKVLAVKIKHTLMENHDQLIETLSTHGCNVGNYDRDNRYLYSSFMKYENMDNGLLDEILNYLMNEYPVKEGFKLAKFNYVKFFEELVESVMKYEGIDADDPRLRQYHMVPLHNFGIHPIELRKRYEQQEEEGTYHLSPDVYTDYIKGLGKLFANVVFYKTKNGNETPVDTTNRNGSAKFPYEIIDDKILDDLVGKIMASTYYETVTK
jgi:predicted SprT family Zn-dependent metalloprotease